MKQTKLFSSVAGPHSRLDSQINEWLVSIKEGQAKKLLDIKLSTVVSSTTNNINVYALVIYEDMSLESKLHFFQKNSEEFPSYSG
jgi:hypothetical protein